MVWLKKKRPTIDTQKLEWKEQAYFKENHQTIRNETKRIRKEQRTIKTTSKQITKWQ